MGPSRKSQVAKAPIARNIRNRTRLHKPRLVVDPAQSTLQLTNQLRALGLYAAPTLGDGNCLFRALADQLWGSPQDHLRLRAEICGWMEARKERYEGFVDEDRSFDTHIKCMRMPGTYGGHLELSAFAHLKRRNVKVIQPGLVYVIEWSCGWGVDSSPSASQVSTSTSIAQEPQDETQLNDRDKRRLRRDKKKQESQKATVEAMARKQPEEAEEEGNQTVYVAYHDWEHFSSVRNLAGPHSGLPMVVERPECPSRLCDELSPPPPPPPPTPKSKSKSKGTAVPQITHGKGKGKGKAPIMLPPSTSSPLVDSNETIPPSQIPLPISRSVSPSTENSSLSHLPSQASASTSTSSAPSSLAPLTPPDTSSLVHDGRSPKRTFDESEDAVPRLSSSSRNVKRRKAPPRRDNNMDIDHELDVNDNTPSFSDASSQSDLTSPTSSTLSSPSPPTPPAEPEPPQKPLTRRQRKMLGLPKPRPVPVNVSRTRSAGKIVIPGGKRTLRSSKGDATDEAGEWQTNGAGRLDVRGFRELKI